MTVTIILQLVLWKKKKCLTTDVKLMDVRKSTSNIIAKFAAIITAIIMLQIVHLESLYTTEQHLMRRLAFRRQDSGPALEAALGLEFILRTVSQPHRKLHRDGEEMQ